MTLTGLHTTQVTTVFVHDVRSVKPADYAYSVFTGMDGGVIGCVN